MLYPTNEDLPASVRRHMPPHAQDTYREAFNLALAARPGEEVWAHGIAWSAVKRSYIKVGDSWITCLAESVQVSSR
jgi:cation transport regulator